MVLPWEDSRTALAPSADFVRWQAEGEAREFQQHDAAAAAASYQQALEMARSPLEECSARLWLGRSYSKAGRTEESQRSDRAMVQECGKVSDADGVPLALYAVGRLLAADAHDGPASDYVLRSAARRQWRRPTRR